MDKQKGMTRREAAEALIFAAFISISLFGINKWFKSRPAVSVTHVAVKP